MIHTVEITETLSTLVQVKAKDKDEALDIVETMYRNSEIVLDAEDYADYQISYQDNLGTLDDESDVIN